MSECAFREVSSSRARELAEKLDLDALKHLVAPLVVSRLLEKALDVEKIFLVVGKPGSGKSTFLKAICKQDVTCTHINTDEFNDLLKPLLLEKFPGEDLIELAINKPAELKAVLKPGWLALLKAALEANRGKRIIFVEVPFGMQDDKATYRYLGGRIIYVGCEKEEENLRRLEKRGTPEHRPFVSAFPGLEKCQEIAREKKLDLLSINTDGKITNLPTKVKKETNNDRKTAQPLAKTMPANTNRGKSGIGIFLDFSGLLRILAKIPCNQPC
jgi:adenylate kinase family enzyme